MDATVDAPPAIDAPGQTGAPVITLISPTVGELVSGIIRLEVGVEDPDGVASVTATIAGNMPITMNMNTPGKWVGFYNTLPLAGLVAPTIVVRATDTTAATSQLGFSVTLDNEAPVASLSPANVRKTKLAQGNLLCSADFDPLGTDAPDDGEAVPQLIELRARVRDLPNTGTLNSSLFIPYAGTQSVQLYMFDDTTKPLVVDTNGDGVCDAINPQIVPATPPMVANEAAIVMMSAIPGAGAASFVPDTMGGTNASTCTVGSDVGGPDALCNGEPSSTIVIKTPFTGDPEIFGVPPVTASNCLGFAFDARASNITDGWACAAVLVTDTLGNRSVSAPLRICIDSDGDLAECPAWGTISSPGSRPNCTGTVTGTTVTATPCTARGFFSSAVANEFELIGD